MKKGVKYETLLVLVIVIILVFASCKTNEKEKPKTIAKNESIVSTEKPKPLTEDFKKYWYAGNAEITSYSLKQARYGEFRPGSAVLIYVTEPFLADKQVKADDVNPNNIPVLKLNSVKNYITGIYPYSLMTSSFYSVHDNSHAIKLSFSAQEWCGHIFAQLNNRDKFEVQSNSYFETEADQKFRLEKTHLENELWNKIRINPNNLPIGEVRIIPSLEFLRQTHKELKAYKASIKIATKNEEIQTYTLQYPELERTLEIDFTKTFPYTIEGWRETYPSGYHKANSNLMTTTAVKNKLIKTPYWQQNKNSNLFLRDSLGL